jgi:hypothetical protein
MKTILATVVGCLLTWAPAFAETQQHFPTPEAAAKALEAAVRRGDADHISRVLGSDSEKIAASGDPVEDAAARKRFTTAAAQRTRIERDGDTALLHVGKDDWPFPIPIVKEAEGWRFDTAAGAQELVNRRVGRNELTVTSVARAYVDAQLEYFARFREFAQSLRSSPGKHDGLYWETTGDEEESPFGPLVALATTEGYQVREADEPPAPYHGYFFRILKAQGKAAPGGARNYVRNGKMTDGFALIAWPAEHGSSGVMTFMVGEQGVVFQKDLGDGTSEAAKAITAYDPDGSWEPTR